MWWSISTLVTTATSGRSSRKLASLSSASATTHSPSPQPAFAAPPSAPSPGTSPPTKKAGSAPSARIAQTTIAAVVVLPWVPATAIRRFSAQSRASSSPRCIDSRPRSRASSSSGLSSAIAVETTTSASVGDVGGVVADRGLEPGVAQPLQIGGVGAVAAGDRRPEAGADERQAAHPGAADADEVEPTPARPLSHARAAPRTSSAIRRAASGLARAAEATTIAASRASSPSSAPTSAAQPPGVIAASATTVAAPASAIQAALALW